MDIRTPLMQSAHMQMLDRIRRSRPHPALAPHFAVGKRGEEVAESHLRTLGYTIIGRNIKVGRHDEIDIIAFDPVDRVYVFAEVKSRSRGDSNFRPEINVTHKKRINMIRAARSWMAKLNQDVGYRMDVVCIVDGALADHFIEVPWKKGRR